MFQAQRTQLTNKQQLLQWGMSSLKEYLDAYDRLDEDNALDTFNDLVEKYPDDHLARFHHQRLGRGEPGKIIIMQSK